MKNMIRLFCIIATFAQCLPAAEPLLKKLNIFTANQDGYAHYRIPGIVVTSKGSLLAYCEARKSLGGDWGQIDIMMRRSADGGKTWSPMRKIVKQPADAKKNEVAVAQKTWDQRRDHLEQPRGHR